MRLDPPRLSEDADFIAKLAKESGQRHGDRMTGLILFVIGGGQGAALLLLWLQAIGLVPGGTAISIGAFLMAIAATASVLIYAGRSGELPGRPSTIVGRAMAGIFCGAGMTTGIMAIIFMHAAGRAQDWNMFAYFPIVFCGLQGTAFFAAGMIRRQNLLMGAGAGWLVTAVLLEFLVGRAGYLLVLGLSFLLLFSGPGWVLYKRGQAS
ncbi:hypothetical protein [Parvularcula marina]|uniref:hypothetical protein n=1 Tax=Parvularcula marina TaxID=2292771 RepID=UPI003513598C